MTSVAPIAEYVSEEWQVEADTQFDDTCAESSPHTMPPEAVVIVNTKHEQPVESTLNTSHDCIECPICMAFLFNPLTLSCRHSFCRVCLLQTTRLSPTGRSCPLCRATVDITNPLDHAIDQDLEATVRTMVPPDVYSTRREIETAKLAEIRLEVMTCLPVFFMKCCISVGSPVRLHFFEPRYKILIRRTWEGNHLFVFCGCMPTRGAHGVIVRVDMADFLPDGRAHIVGRGVEAITLEDTWVEDGTGQLFYTRVNSLVSMKLTPSQSTQSQSQEARVEEPAQPSDLDEASPASRCRCVVM